MRKASASYQVIALALISIGTATLFFMIFLFGWKSKSKIQLSSNSTIDSTLLNDFGSLTAGTVGILWSLAGVLLLIASLKEQRRATDENVKTLRSQQFENTFFQLINVHYQIVNSLSIIFQDDLGLPEKNEEGIPERKKGIICFLSLAEQISNRVKSDTEFSEETFRLLCAKQLYVYNAELGHYFGNFFNIIIFIDSSNDISAELKFKFANILKSQLSNYELVVLLYFTIARNDATLIELVEKYCVLEHLDFELEYATEFERVLVEPALFISKFPHLKLCLDKKTISRV